MWAWGTAGGVGWCWLLYWDCKSFSRFDFSCYRSETIHLLVTNIKVDIFMDWEGNQKVVVGMTGETAHVG